MNLLDQLRLRPRLLLAIAAGLMVGLFSSLVWPAEIKTLTRCLLGWTFGIWFYLALCLRMMLKTSAAHLERTARAQVDGIVAVLLLAVLGTLASLAVITLELAQIRQGMPAAQALPHWILLLATVLGSWLFLPVEFGLAYASLYHASNDAGSASQHGLEFPGQSAAKDQHPDYFDFMYLAFTVATSSATSDVAITGRHVRRLVLLHAVLSFMFNTGVLALMINILAGLVN